MKATKSIFTVLFVMLTAQIASAYYCPSTGRWLSRDPVGETGFQALQATGALPQSRNFTSLPPSSWIQRYPAIKPKAETALTAKNDINTYTFVQNTPTRFIDPLGLSAVDVANIYNKFLDTFDNWCKSAKCCPELGWKQNFPGTPYWGCTKQSENLQAAFDTLKFEDGWDIQNHYEGGILFHHNSVDLIPFNTDDPVIHADTWKGCLSITWPVGSSQNNFSKCWTCKERLGWK
ncbi:MAG: hypothetical protein WCJ07_02415, partial [Verrucomicrobiota bacterium]